MNYITNCINNELQNQLFKSYFKVEEIDLIS